LERRAREIKIGGKQMEGFIMGFIVGEIVGMIIMGVLFMNHEEE
jgi:hypothetical protein